MAAEHLAQLSSDEIDDVIKKHHNLSLPYKETIYFYKMYDGCRRLAIIFSHENFDNNLEKRIGTRYDQINLENALQNLGFDVKIFVDLNWERINSIITETAAMDHRETDCLLVAIFSHGGTDMVYAKDTYYNPNLIWDKFTMKNCPSLYGKPKLFLIQCCLGDKLDDGITIESDGDLGSECSSFHHPDFLIVYSTVPGYTSWRENEGSWFIQTLCTKLKKYGFTEDILKILTRVSWKVATKLESFSYNPKYDQKKQVPCIISTLRHLLLFTQNQSKNVS